MLLMCRSILRIDCASTDAFQLGELSDTDRPDIDFAFDV